MAGAGPDVGRGTVTASPPRPRGRRALRVPAGGAWRRMPAGVADSGLSSLATLLVGLAAVRYLTPGDLGAYSLCYSAFLLAAAVPATTIFVPAEAVSAATWAPPQRIRLPRETLRLAAPVVMVAAVAAPALVLAVPGRGDAGHLRLMVVTLAGAAALSPVQDHLRRVLHQAERSWSATAVSGCQVLLVVGLLALGLGTGHAGAPYLPFGTLCVANLTSLLAGLALARGGERDVDTTPLGLSLRGSIQTGRWLLLGQLLTFGAGFAVLAAITARSSAVAAGQVEAARLLSQPVAVLIIGALAVLGPSLIRAAATGQRAWVLRTTRLFIGVVVALALGWAVVAGPHWGVSPLPTLFPAAYQVAGLLPAMIVGQALGYAAGAYNNVLLGRSRAGVLTVLTALEVAASLAVGIGLSARGAIAAGVAGLLAAVLALILLRVAVGRVLTELPAESPGPAYS